jgi:hypothetical protein
MNLRDVPIFARVIGALQFVGGVMGVWLAAPAMVAFESFSFIATFIAAVYVLSVVAGVGAFRWTRWGRRLSLAVQAVELLSVTTTSLSFSFVSGAGLWLTLGRAGVTTQRVLGSAFEFHTQSGFGPGIVHKPFEIGVNVIAATAFVWLLRHRAADGETSDEGASVPGTPDPSRADSVLPDNPSRV